MFNREQLLQFAFDEAALSLNPTVVDDDVVEDLMITGMRKYSDREGYDFTDSEISATVKKGLAVLDRTAPGACGEKISFSREELLSFAFDHAVTAVNPAAMEPEMVQEVLTTSMNAYSESGGYNFTDEEISLTIEKGLDALKNASADFSLQNKMMY